MINEKADTLLNSLSNKIQLFTGKISNQRHLSAMRDAFVTIIPFVIMGSFAILINSVFIEPDSLIAKLFGAETVLGENNSLYDSWSQVSFYISPIFESIAKATMNFFAIYIAILLGYFLAGTYKDNKLFGGLIGLICFFALQPTSALVNNPMGYFNSTGIWFAMFAGLTGPTIYHHLSNCKKLTIKTPDGVPPAIADSFSTMIPIILTILIFALFQPIWGAFAYGVGFGANTIDYTFFKLSGTISYQLEEGGQPLDKTGTIIVEQGTGLYTLMNLIQLSGLLSIFDEKSIIVNQLTNEVISGLDKVSFLNLWLNNQIASIIGKEDIWFNVTVDYSATFFGESPTYGASFISETIKVINEDWYYLMNTINSIIVLPLQNAGDSAWFVFIVYGLYTLVFFFGIHGGNVLAPLIIPFFVVAILHNIDVLIVCDFNIDAALASEELRIFTNQTAESFLVIGGAGATLGLMVALWIFSKSPSSRQINKSASASAVFNTNEQYIFGLPIILNLRYAIPFIFLQPILGVGIYYITASGWMNPTFFYVPWTIPVGFNGLISTVDPKSLIVSLTVFIISFLAYAPFVLLDAKGQVKDQLEESENKNYFNLKIDLQKVKKKLIKDSSNKELIDQKNQIKLEIKNLENEVVEIGLFNIKASSEGEYFPKGEELIKEKYALIYENLLNNDFKKEKIKIQLDNFDKKIRILGAEAKCDTKIIESNDILFNKINHLEDEKNQNIALLNTKLNKFKKDIITKNNNLDQKANLLMAKINNKIIIPNSEKIDSNKKNILFDKKILEIKEILEIKKNNNQTKIEEKISILIEKNKKNELEIEETILKIQNKNKKFINKNKRKISAIQNNKKY